MRSRKLGNGYSLALKVPLVERINLENATDDTTASSSAVVNKTKKKRNKVKKKKKEKTRSRSRSGSRSGTRTNCNEDNNNDAKSNVSEVSTGEHLHVTLLYFNNLKRGYQQDMVKRMATEYFEQRYNFNQNNLDNGFVDINIRDPNTSNDDNHDDSGGSGDGDGCEVDSDRKNQDNDDVKQPTRKLMIPLEYGDTHAERSVRVLSDELEQIAQHFKDVLFASFDVDIDRQTLHVDLRGHEIDELPSTIELLDNWYI